MENVVFAQTTTKFSPPITGTVLESRPGGKLHVQLHIPLPLGKRGDYTISEVFVYPEYLIPLC